MSDKIVLSCDEYKINLSSSAVDRIIHLRSKENGLLKLLIHQAGCAGYSCNISWENEPKKNDFIFYLNNDSILAIPSESITYLNDSNVDYLVEDEFSEGFVVNDINVNGFCKCGSSFNIAD